ncbi:hypothetical protein BJF85_23650 [Saccharomonospora sp. CUA-673]|uniref:hypothetical protein n=1 Tax=Saccharomonospora sp. CUA-673 TaxID=1904969 RepID=UPI00096715CF|nr:hypothetical protein [Saccharomonospora sp. CUA-673]OLT42070.1 hypothetical protein BJF85_23650 [Saccharomonospora sp. CUA-673]
MRGPTVLDDTVLDDPQRLGDADTGGLLRAVAMGGAQVRSTIEAAQELGLAERLDIGRPRSLVIVVRPGSGLAAAQVVEALLAPACPVPVVFSDVVPPWIGALDVVLAHTDDPYDRDLAASLERAARYGATVVLSGPSEGPVASAVAGRGLLLSPRIVLPPELSFPRALTAGLLTAGALGLLVCDVDGLADRLDNEAARGHLDQESFVNPAKSLALRIADRTPLLWGLDHVAVAVGQHAAYALGAHAAVVADVADYRQALARPALHTAAARGSDERDIFADPEFDEVGAANPPRALLLSVRTGPATDSARYRVGETLPTADVLAPAEELVEADDVACAAVLALRFELAAVYLGLAAGTIGGAGRVAPMSV